MNNKPKNKKPKAKKKIVTIRKKNGKVVRFAASVASILILAIGIGACSSASGSRCPCRLELRGGVQGSLPSVADLSAGLPLEQLADRPSWSGQVVLVCDCVPRSGLEDVLVGTAHADTPASSGGLPIEVLTSQGPLTSGVLGLLILLATYTAAGVRRIKRLVRQEAVAEVRKHARSCGGHRYVPTVPASGPVA